MERRRKCHRDSVRNRPLIPFSFHVQLVDVSVRDGVAREAVCAGKNGLFALRAKVFVDCTGDGDRAVFDDEIGRYSYPVDIHIARPDKESFEKFSKEFSSMRLGKGESYGIPYRVLTPRGLGNVLVAGRCVSTDRNMQASIRVMPGCYITGQAAGVAAAMSVQAGTDTRGIDVGELQWKLRRMGAFLPNAQRT